MAAITAIIALASVGLSSAPAQGADPQVVTVTVLERDSITVAGGDITISVSPLNPAPTTNQSCDLDWFANGQGNKKITVRSSLVAPRYSLTVEARNIVGKGSEPGTPAGPVPLRDDVDRDFITRIRSSIGACDLLYSATATWAAGIGTDVHVVTYTLTDR